MNDLFVNIKVDREERPDIDQIYMSALHLMGEHGGWPLTMFLTPEGRAVLGRHVFPEDEPLRQARLRRRAARTSRASSARTRRASSRTARALMARLAESARPQGRVVIGRAELDRAAQQLGGIIDPVNGGTRGAPKFPQPMLLEFLWRAGQRTGEARYFNAVELTLERICAGRHLRSSRRRLLALLGRRALAGAAFREDALRQRAASGAARARLSALRQRTLYPRRARRRRSPGSSAR